MIAEGCKKSGLLKCKPLHCKTSLLPYVAIVVVGDVKLCLRHQVTAFSRWERELLKLQEDERFKAIPAMKDKRALFDDYCKNFNAEQVGECR
jgi:hypothetical protein